MLKISQPNINDEAIQAAIKTIKSGQLVHGEESHQFEAELMAFLDCKHASLVSSGTAALHLALLTLGIGPGDIVLVPDFTFPATANVVAMVGAKPVLVDVELESYSTNAYQFEQALEKYHGSVKALIVVHEFGYPVQMAPIIKLAKEHNLYVIEDAACALGAKCDLGMAGTIGDIGCFSFHPRKTITTGEGGLVTTRSKVYASRINLLRDHGIDRNSLDPSFTIPGLNYRLTNFQAALARPQLAQLPDWIEKRKELAQAYTELLSPLQAAGLLKYPTSNPGHSWQTFMITLSERINRKAVISRLANLGIESNIGAHALHNLEFFKNTTPVKNLKNAHFLSRSGLALPFCEKYTKDDLKQVTEKLWAILKEEYHA